MLRIIISICLMAVLWAGNWAWGYRANLASIVDWFDAAKSSYGAPSQSGFPNRYDVTVPDVTIRAIGFQAEFIQILRVVYKTDHRIIVLPNRFSIFDFDIQGKAIRASLVHEGAHIPRTVIEGSDLTLPHGLTAKRGQISVMPNVGENQFIAYVWLENATLNDIALAPDIKLTIAFELPSGPTSVGMTPLIDALKQVRKLQIATETAQEARVQFDTNWPISSDINTPLTPDMAPLLDWVTEFTH